MFKTFLLKFPWLYEIVQSIRDYIAHNKYLKSGTFSQHREDLEIMKLLDKLKARGPYVDIGCNHPFRLSNTYLLYLNGWRGLCVDPLPRFVKLHKKWRPLDNFACVGISEIGGEMPLYEFESDVLSTLDKNQAEQYQAAGYKFRRKIQTKIEDIDSLLEAHGLDGPISLLSIDIEGHELSALRSITLDRWKPQLVCLEVVTADGFRNEEAIRYLLENGYKIESDLKLNLIFRRIAS